MQNIVLTIHLILAVALIIVVLLQRSEGGGLGIGGGGGGGIMTGRGAATALSKLTWILGAAFVVTSLTLTVLAARGAGQQSVLDRLGIEQPAGGQTGTGAPDLGGDLLPPTVPRSGGEGTAPAPPAPEPTPAPPAATDEPATPPAQ